MKIRKATEDDLEAMWAIFQATIATGDTLPYAASTDKAVFRSHWFADGQSCYVASGDSHILGMYTLGANYQDLGSHVASATYVVRPEARGQGIGRALVEDSIARAREAGYLAMQFNYVVSTNTVGVSLYEKLGFSIVGTVPKAFQHQTLGLVDVYVMHRFV